MFSPIIFINKYLFFNSPNTIRVYFSFCIYISDGVRILLCGYSNKCNFFFLGETLINVIELKEK